MPLSNHYDLPCARCGGRGKVFQPAVVEEIDPGVFWETGALVCESCGREERHSRIKVDVEPAKAEL